MHFWRKYSHGKIIGVAHSTIRFWDIRYFYSLSTLSDKQNCSLPRPDKIAVNGKPGWRLLIDSGFNEKDLVEVEALRYQYLSTATVSSSILNQESTQKSLLIIGDFTIERTIKMLDIATKANHLSDNHLNISLKPHPACRLGQLSQFNFTVINEPIGCVARNFDYVFSSNTTSASLDAYLSGVAVFVFLDGKDFNFSPLREKKDVFFVGCANDLIEGLKIKQYHFSKIKTEDFFWLDEHLPRWIKCFQEAGIGL